MTHTSQLKKKSCRRCLRRWKIYSANTAFIPTVLGLVKRAQSHHRHQAQQQEPVATVIEELEHDGEGFSAKVRWLYNPVPVGETLSWEHPKMNNLETLRHRIRVHIANREHYSKVEFLDKLHEILHESEQTAAPVQEPFGWWFTPNGEFLLPTEVEVDNPRNYETYRAMYIDTPPAAPVPMDAGEISRLWKRHTNPDGPHHNPYDDDGLGFAKAVLAAAQPAPTVQEPKEIAELVEGMEVSIDVSTGDHDSGNRLFGTVTRAQENQGSKHGLILLVQSPEANFKTATAPATPVPLTEPQRKAIYDAVQGLDVMKAILMTEAAYGIKET